MSKLSAAGEDLSALGGGHPPAPRPSLAGGYFRALMAAFLVSSALGWAVSQSRRNYRSQES